MGTALVAVVLAAAALSAQARSLQDILERGRFTICVHPDALPYSVKQSRPEGLQIDIAEAIAAQLGVGVVEEWVVYRRDARQVGCDAIMAGVAKDGPGDAAPSGRIPPGPVMTRPYAANLTRVVTRAGAPPVTLVDDLNGRSVAVLPASYAHYLLDKRGTAVRTPYHTEAEILEAVDKGEMDAGIVSDWSFGWYRKNHPDARLQPVEDLVIDPELDFNVAVVLRNVDAPLLSKVNDILGTMTSGDEMARIFGRYGIDYHPPLTPRAAVQGR
jgi:polar amino acid transport system substrate-binding protein